MNVQKRSVQFVLLLLLVASFLFTLNLTSADVGDYCTDDYMCNEAVGERCVNEACQVIVSAQTSGATTNDGTTGLEVTSGSTSSWMKALKLDERWNLWVKGSENMTQSDVTLLGETLKYLILFIIIIAVYSAFSALSFPEGPAFRWVLAIIVGLLGTFMITTKELLTALLSYSALSTTILIALPVIVLLGLTVMAAYKTSSIGLYASKVLWAAYSIFLFVKGFILVVLFQTFYVVSKDGKYVANFVDPTSTNVPSYLLPFLPKISSTGGKTVLNEVALGNMIGNADLTIAFVLLISAAIIFIFMVLNSKWIIMWMEKEARNSMIEARKTQAQLASASERIEADKMRSAGKPV